MPEPPVSGLELFGWILQVALIASVATGRARLRLPEPTLAACIIVLLAAWLFRLAELFALASTGLDYWIGDDALRWARAARWWSDPYLVRLDQDWLAGGYILHSLAMEIAGDPLVGSKLLAALLAVLPLAGLFVFAQAVFGRRAVSCACVVVAAPWWIHVLLSSGTMTGMPTTGLMLGGSGLLVFAVREAGSSRRRWLVAGAALLFAAATALHFASWLQLAAVIACLGVHAVTRPPDRRRAALREWVGFSVLSTPVCVVFLLTAWVATGRPFGLFEGLAAQTTYKLGGAGASWLEIGALYPHALVYSIRAFLPLLAWGLVWPFLTRSDTALRARWVLACLGAPLLVLIATALAASGTNLTPFRTVTGLATALVPFAVAPLLGGVRDAAPGSLRSDRLGAALAILVVAGLVVVNHQRIWLEAPTPTSTELRLDEPANLRGDAAALGAWLRREDAAPTVLHRAELERPILVVLTPPSVFKRIALEYAIGDPQRVAYLDVDGLTIGRPEPGRILVSDARIEHPDLRAVKRVARYFVYSTSPAPSARAGSDSRP
jgi:hypothetical protein